MPHSEEDTDVKAIVHSWLSKKSEEDKKNLPQWIEDYFYKGLEWVLKHVRLFLVSKEFWFT